MKNNFKEQFSIINNKLRNIDLNQAKPHSNEYRNILRKEISLLGQKQELLKKEEEYLLGK